MNDRPEAYKIRLKEGSLLLNQKKKGGGGGHSTQDAHQALTIQITNPKLMSSGVKRPER